MNSSIGTVFVGTGRLGVTEFGDGLEVAEVGDAGDICVRGLRVVEGGDEERVEARGGDVVVA